MCVDSIPARRTAGGDAPSFDIKQLALADYIGAGGLGLFNREP